MKPGSVLVDISIDQGGCFEDSQPTTHADPTYKVHDSVFYCVANMPGAVPHTSTYALTNVTLPYAVELAEPGLAGRAARRRRRWRSASTPTTGQVTYAPVAEAHGLPGPRRSPRSSPERVPVSRRGGQPVRRQVADACAPRSAAYLDHLPVERGVAANTLLSYRRDLGRYLAYLRARGRRRA